MKTYLIIGLIWGIINVLILYILGSLIHRNRQADIRNVDFEIYQFALEVFEGDKLARISLIFSTLLNVIFWPITIICNMWYILSRIFKD